LHHLLQLAAAHQPIGATITTHRYLQQVNP